MKVLFMCTANSCRSQMAEAWARHLLPGDWEIASAGLITHPISSNTRQVMNEVGLDLAGQNPETMDAYDLESFDLIVTLSRNSGRFLPALPAATTHWHRPVSDPMSFSGSREETIEAFRVGRDRIRTVVEEVLEAEFASE